MTTLASVRAALTLQGDLRSLNELAKTANATHILHTGDFGFYDHSSLERIAEKYVPNQPLRPLAYKDQDPQARRTVFASNLHERKATDSQHTYW